MNKDSKSGKYNFSLTTLNDNYSGIMLSYVINEYSVTERVTRTCFDSCELVTMGFNNGTDLYNYIALLEGIDVQQLTEDKTTVELLGWEERA